MDKDTITITLDGFDYDYASSASMDYNIGDISIDTGVIDIGNVTVHASDVYVNDNITVDIGENFSFEWFEDQRIVDEYKEEKEIRERNEGVQKAWEQYKIMVELAKMPPDIDEENQ